MIICPECANEHFAEPSQFNSSGYSETSVKCANCSFKSFIKLSGWSG